MGWGGGGGIFGCVRFQVCSPIISIPLEVFMVLMMKMINGCSRINWQGCLVGGSFCGV